MARRWVVNASPLIFLGKVGQLDLLLRLAADLMIPEAVAREVTQGPGSDPARLWLEGFGRRFVLSDRGLSPTIAAWDLGPGESQVLQFCLAESGSEAIVDDRAARECAAAIGVGFRGTISVLTLAKHAGLVSAVRPLLNDLVAAGFRISTPVMARALELAGE